MDNDIHVKLPSLKRHNYQLWRWTLQHSWKNITFAPNSQQKSYRKQRLTQIKRKDELNFVETSYPPYLKQWLRVPALSYSNLTQMVWWQASMPFTWQIRHRLDAKPSVAVQRTLRLIPTKIYILVLSLSNMGWNCESYLSADWKWAGYDSLYSVGARRTTLYPPTCLNSQPQFHMREGLFKFLKSNSGTSTNKYDSISGYRSVWSKSTKFIVCSSSDVRISHNHEMLRPTSSHRYIKFYERPLTRSLRFL